MSINCEQNSKDSEFIVIEKILTFEMPHLVNQFCSTNYFEHLNDNRGYGFQTDSVN